MRGKTLGPPEKQSTPSTKITARPRHSQSRPHKPDLQIAPKPTSNCLPGLAAYDASNLGRELRNSDLEKDRDALGYFAKFNPPTIANGKVYVAAFPNPEPYVSVVFHGNQGEQITQSYHAPNSMGYVVI